MASSSGRFSFLEQYKNMHVIIEEDFGEKKGALWLGDYTAALDKDTLKQKGINTVLTTAQGLNLYYPSSAKIIHRQWFMLDHPSFNIARYFQDVITEIEEGLRRGGVLVHCAAGISRSASCVIAFLMQKKQMAYPSAFNFVKKKRRVVSPNPGFLKQLQQFDKQLQSLFGTRRTSFSKGGNVMQTSNTQLHIGGVGNNQVDPSFSDAAYSNYYQQAPQKNTTTERSNAQKVSDENVKVMTEDEKRLHNLTKQIVSVPMNNTLKPKNSPQKSVDDRFLKNSMEMLKSKSHKFMIKRSDSKGTIRFNRNGSLEPNNFINVQKQQEQPDLKPIPQSTKANTQQSIFDMLYVQQQLKKKFQAKPQKTVTIAAQNMLQKQPMFISQAQKNLRKTFSYLNPQKENMI